MKREAKLDLILSVIAIILSFFAFYSLFQMLQYESGTFEEKFWAFNMITTVLILTGLIGIYYLILRIITPPHPEEKTNEEKEQWRIIKIFVIILAIISLSFQGGSLFSMFYISIFLGSDAIQMDIHSLFIYLGLGMELLIALLIVIFFMSKNRRSKNNSTWSNL